MNLQDLIGRPQPQAWVEGDNIPWNEPGFSRRMLEFHLSQQNDAASRRGEKIDRHVSFLHGHVLAGRASSILDLGCGPGLYLQRLARLGHTCRGIDFSPASIDYARRAAALENLPIAYELGDLRQVDYGVGYDLVMQIYGEFNVFRPQHAKQILSKAFAALRPGGVLLLELSPEPYVRCIGDKPPSWSAQASGLFSDRPHLLLEDSAWDEGLKTATNRYTLIDAETGEVTTFGASYQAYSDEELAGLIEGCGFCSIHCYPNLENAGEERAHDFIVVVAEHP